MNRLMSYDITDIARPSGIKSITFGIYCTLDDSIADSISLKS